MLFYDRTFDFKSILENMKVNIEFQIKNNYVNKIIESADCGQTKPLGCRK